MMRQLTDILLASLIPGLIGLYLYYAPYTKVEESFNLQATHDILTFGLPSSKAGLGVIKRYDHNYFPGSVPRTFVGPLALSGASWPFIKYLPGINRQTIVRAVLGVYNASCLLYFRKGIARTFGRGPANWYVLFQASQFHVMYYASRTLPNFFAFGLTVCALHDLLPHFAMQHRVYEKKKMQTVSVHPSNPHSLFSIHLYRRAIVILTATGAIFRSELALLLASHAFYLLIQRRISLDPLHDIIPYGLLGLFIGIALSLPIDSYFWQHFPTWPEFDGFIYNAIEGKAADWGVSPFHFFFSSALPRLLFNPLICYLCIPIALTMRHLRKPARDIFLPNLFFIFLYSFQPHKEWRFIVYAVPPLLAVAAAGASCVWTRRARSYTYRFLSLCLVASTLASFGASFAMLAISRLNYPGAQALDRLHAVADGKQKIVSVHMDTLSCTTGITRFLEKPVLTDITPATIWRYDKTEDVDKLLDPFFWQQFDYALAENPERVIGKWEIEEIVDGYAGLGLLRPGQSLNENGPWNYDGSDSPLRVYLQIRSLHDLRKEIHSVEQHITEMARDLTRRLRTGELKTQFLKNWEQPRCSAGNYREVDWQKVQVQAQIWLYENVRRYLTAGWWVKPRMEPKIRILRKQGG